MRRKEEVRRLRSELASANREIERLRAALCKGDHDFVLVDEWPEDGGNSVIINFEYVCSRCGQRKMESR